MRIKLGGNRIINEGIHHTQDRVFHVLAVEDFAPLGVNQLTLFIHDLVVLKELFTDAEVVALDLFLCGFDRLGEHFVLDLLTILHAERLKDAHHTLRSEQPHQIILKRDVETGLARVSLSSGTAAQLIVDTSGLMALCADNLEASGIPRIIVQLDIGTTAGHVRRNSDGAVHAGIGNDLRFHLMELGIQDVVLNTRSLEHLREKLRHFDRDRADQNRLSLGVSLFDRINHCLILFSLGLIDRVIIVHADDRDIRRNLDNVHPVDLTELFLLRERGTGHTGFLIIFVEQVLERDRRQRLGFASDLDMLLRLDRLMQAVRITPARHNTSGELVDNHDFVFRRHDIILITVHQIVRAQCQDDIVLDLQILRISEIVDMEELFHPTDTFLGQVNLFLLLIDDKVAGLLDILAHDRVHLGEFTARLAPL